MKTKDFVKVHNSRELKIYYATKDEKILVFEIEPYGCCVFEDFIQMIHQLDDRKTVYLMTSKEKKEEEIGLEEIRITQHNSQVIKLIGNARNWEGYDIFIEEYESFEEAYKVALNMREPNPLCYAPE